MYQEVGTVVCVDTSLTLYKIFGKSLITDKFAKSRSEVFLILKSLKPWCRLIDVKTFVFRHAFKATPSRNKSDLRDEIFGCRVPQYLGDLDGSGRISGILKYRRKEYLDLSHIYQDFSDDQSLNQRYTNI